MAACGSLQHIFDKPLDPPPPLFDPTHINPMKPVDRSTSDVFSGLNLSDTISSVTTELDPFNPDQHRRSGSLSSAKSESLSEALGFESFDDVERFDDQWEQGHEHRQSVANTTVKNVKQCETKRSRISGKEIPPPISSIGRRVCFKSYRYNGRLVLKEVKIPAQELLHAYREDGRLKLQFVHFDDEVAIERGNGEKVGDDSGMEGRRSCDEADDDTEKNEIREE